ncbi:MAG: tRNA (adenosine(37)-N6)-threonylcarbamoyltransferase complex dimerization subunit type 1 TsaB [Mariniphaga sp.]
MALLLNIETSTEVCSVALANDGVVVGLRESLTGQHHAELLTVYINEVLDECGIIGSQIDAVAVSGGPGSYTGLRIGVSTAKGICYASGLPLIALSSLEAMAGFVIQHLSDYYPSETENVLFCPMIDARRMEVYTAFYDKNGVQFREIKADIIDHHSYLSYLENNTVLFFGNGAFKCRDSIRHRNAIFVDGITTSSQSMVPLSERDFQLNKFVDVAYYEPFYLKDFVATIPVKNIFKGGNE